MCTHKFEVSSDVALADDASVVDRGGPGVHEGDEQAQRLGPGRGVQQHLPGTIASSCMIHACQCHRRENGLLNAAHASSSQSYYVGIVSSLLKSLRWDVQSKTSVGRTYLEIPYSQYACVSVDIYETP